MRTMLLLNSAYIYVPFPQPFLPFLIVTNNSFVTGKPRLSWILKLFHNRLWRNVLQLTDSSFKCHYVCLSYWRFHIKLITMHFIGLSDSWKINVVPLGVFNYFLSLTSSHLLNTIAATTYITCSDALNDKFPPLEILSRNSVIIRVYMDFTNSVWYRYIKNRKFFLVIICSFYRFFFSDYLHKSF